MKISIITPTYNRDRFLKRFYQSLAAQHYGNLEWIIVADGSRDQTTAVVKELQQQSEFEIKYIAKENGGKHTAMNTGIKAVTGVIVAIVDDDDYFLPDTFTKIAADFSKIMNDNRLCGTSYLCMDQERRLLGRKFPAASYRSDHIRCRINQNISGDKIEFFKSAILKSYEFPVIPGEKFVSETVLWIKIAKEYQTLYLNRFVLVKEYTGAGITRNWRRIALENPRGMLMYYRSHLDKDCALKVRLKYMVAYIAISFCLQKNENEIFSDSGAPWLCAVCFLPGLLCGVKWRSQMLVLGKSGKGAFL